MSPTVQRCAFCDHEFAGRRRRFCLSCLPPFGEWDDPKSYNAHYNLLCRAVGLYHDMIGTWPACQLPEPPPLYGPPRPTECTDCWLPHFGDGDHCKDCSKVRSAYARANAAHPRRSVPTFDFVEFDLASVKPFVCRACMQQFRRRPGSGFGNTYCIDCTRQAKSYYKGRGAGPSFVRRLCKGCGGWWAPELGNRRTFYCSDRCLEARPATPPIPACRLTSCLDCGQWGVYPKAKRCSHCRSVIEHLQGVTSNAKSSRRRRSVYRQGDRSITWQSVGQRDDWRCHICSKTVKQYGSAKDPLSASVDHLIPLSDGGRHEWDNVALAHRRCNSKRGNQGTVQLRLVG